MLYATVREDLKGDGVEAFYGSLTRAKARECLDSSMNTIPDSAYPIQVLHQDDDGIVYLLLNDEVTVGDSIDFDFMHDECERSNLTEDKTRCWNCDPGE